MLPELFHIGPLKVHSWGVLLMFGFLLGTWRAARSAPRYGIKTEDVWDVGLWGLLGGVLGARLVYVLLTWSEFRAHPAAIFQIWEGGMTFYGGMGGGILAGALVCRIRRIRIGDMADLAAMAFPIAYALGRVGCFLNGCCYGGVCDLPWAVRFHDASMPGGLTPPSHPAQLYSAIISVAIYFLLARMEPRRRFSGQLLLAYLFLYGVYRFGIEFLRAGATSTRSDLAGLTEGQIASLLLAIFAAAFYAAGRRRAGQGTGSAPAPKAAATSS